MQTVDFLPERIRTQRRRRRRLVRNSYVAVLVLAALAALGCWIQGHVAQARAELQHIHKQKQGVRVQLDMLDSLETQQAELMIKKRISDQLGSRVNIMDVLRELQRLLPASMSLTDLTLETMEVRSRPTRVVGSHRSSRAAVPADLTAGQDRVVRRVRLVLTGVAPTDVAVANFIGQLSASQLFEEVTMGYARNFQVRGQDAREFRVSCYVAR